MNRFAKALSLAVGFLISIITLHSSSSLYVSAANFTLPPPPSSNHTPSSTIPKLHYQYVYTGYPDSVTNLHPGFSSLVVDGPITTNQYPREIFAEYFES